MAKEKSEEFKKFEELDKSYGKDKSAYEVLEADKAEMNRLKLAIMDAREEVNKIKSSNQRANLMGTKPPYDKAAIEQAEKDEKKAVKDLEDFRAKIAKGLEKVNNRFKELEKNPEMKKQLDSILATKMERAIKKDQKEIENFKLVQKIMEEHPNVKGTIRNISLTNRRIDSLKAKIEKIEKKPDTARTDEENQQLADAKSSLTKEEANLASRKGEMDKFFDKSYPDLSKEQREFITGLNTIKIDKAIAGKEKSIATKQKAYKELTGKEYEAPAKEAKETSEDKSLPPAKISRWQKFKNWVKRAWNGEKADSKPAETKEESKKEKASSEFRSAYKYDIVKDYVSQKESEMLKQSKQASRAEKEDDKDKDER